MGTVIDPNSSTTTKLSDDVIKIILSNGDKITRANWKQQYRLDVNNPTDHIVYNLISDPLQWSSSGCGTQAKEFYVKYDYDEEWGSALYSESTSCSCAINGWSNTRKDSCGEQGCWIASCEKAPSSSHCCACVTYDERADIVLYIR